MTFTFRPAKRENVPLLIGVAGGTGSGKTYSALRLAAGIAQGKRFVVIDTENGRARIYADEFEFDTTDIVAPFRPSKYADAVDAADAAGYPVIVVDSTSHEWYGEGGCLDWHDELMGGQQSKNLSAWIEPKKDHKRMVTRLLQVRAHVILCFRAEPKVEAIKEGGQTKIVPKASLTGLDGWIPIAEKNLPYELTASFLLMADHPGVPRPIKLPEKLRPFVPLDRPLGEETGKALCEWAAGGANARPAPAPAAAPTPSVSDDELEAVLKLASEVSDETRATAQKAIDEHRAKHGQVNPTWLGKMRASLESIPKPAAPEPEPDQDEDPSAIFKIPESARQPVAS